MKSVLFTLFLLLSTIGFGQLNPLSVGTIHPGDSIVIKYDVTINSPLPPATTQISNQGTVSGSNFSNVVTDDPDSGPLNDPTITILNMFPLPVTLTELKARQSGNTITLNWKVETEYNLEKYVVERSTNGRAFIAIGDVPARNLPGTLHYSFTDNQPNNDINFYRLRTVDIDGTKKYSIIVKVVLGGSMKAIHIFPNPVPGLSINVQMQNTPAGPYNIRLYNMYGQEIFTKTINHAGGSATEIIYFPATMNKGMYLLKINDATSSGKSFQVVVL